MHTISSIIISILVFSAILIGINAYSFLTPQTYGYNLVNISYYAPVEKTISVTENMTQPLNTTEINMFTGSMMFASAVVNSIMMSINVLSIFPTMISNISFALNLPSWFTDIILAIITITIIAGILKALLGRGNV